MHGETHPLDNEDVAKILDILFADHEDHDPEPDWAAIETRIFECRDSLYHVMLDLLKAFWLVYEDEAAALSALYARTP